MTGKDKVVKCCGAIEAEVELTEHLLLSGWAPWALETIARQALRRRECFYAGLSPTAGSLG